MSHVQIGNQVPIYTHIHTLSHTTHAHTVMGDYGALSLVFDVTFLPQNQYNSTEWKNNLTTMILNYITTTYRISKDLIEIENIEVHANSSQTSTVAPQHSVLKRATEPMFLYVSLNILPQSLSKTHISSAKTVSYFVAPKQEVVNTYM